MLHDLNSRLFVCVQVWSYARYLFFFFSSRRRHTRWPRDWSSDVCSSDLFYIAIFDVDEIDEVGMDAQNSPVVSTVYLEEVVEDYTADMDGDGVRSEERRVGKECRAGWAR